MVDICAYLTLENPLKIPRQSNFVLLTKESCSVSLPCKTRMRTNKSDRFGGNSRCGDERKSITSQNTAEKARSPTSTVGMADWACGCELN